MTSYELIPLNKSIIKNFGAKYFSEGGFYYNGYQDLFSKLNPKEVLLEVYEEINKIENEYEYVVDFKEFIKTKSEESIVGESSFKFIQDDNKNDVIIYKSSYVFFIELLRHFSNLYFVENNSRINEILSVINNESAKFYTNPYCHILLKTLKIEFSNYKSSNDIRDYVNKSMKMLLGKKELKFYNEIFINRRMQNLFVKCLIDMNVINEKTLKSKRRLSGRANAIFSNKHVKTKVFKYRLPLNTYIRFLNDAFQANIKDETRLSESNKDDIDFVSDYFS